MNKWRISRIRINGFKVFSSFDEQYNGDLIIYDGPNGFGKTSLFDAKQLLFRGQLPRIKARLKSVTTSSSKRSFETNIYRHNGYSGDICIAAELTNGIESICIMRKAEAKDMKAKKNNNPNEFSIFKLYKLDNYDDWTSAKKITDENLFWQKIFGENFQKNFDILNYLQQDSKALIIPDGCCEDTARTKQIEHLINLDEFDVKLEKIKNLKDAHKRAYDNETRIINNLGAEVNKLKEQLTVPANAIDYCRLTTTKLQPVWDKETPLTSERLSDYPEQVNTLNLLKMLVDNSTELEIRDRNRKKSDFLKTEDFNLTVRLTEHFNKLSNLKSLRIKRKALEQAFSIVTKKSIDVKEVDLPFLVVFLGDRFDDFSLLIKQKDQLKKYQSSIGAEKTKSLELRKQLKATIDDKECNCPLCGFDYSKQQLLINAIDIRTHQIKSELDKNGKEIDDCLSKISLILEELLLVIKIQIENIDKEYNPYLLKDLEDNEHKLNRLNKIAARLKSLDLNFPKDYADKKEKQAEQVEVVRQQILLTLEPESDTIPEQALSLYYSFFNSPEEIKSITHEKIEHKRNYIFNQYSKLVSETYDRKHKEYKKSEARLKAISVIKNRIRDTELQINKARNTYINHTLGEIELIFHIYSGRLLQNIQTGLGIFLDRPDGSQKDTPLQFKTVRGNEHDAVLSMSSGQVSALALSLFLALNKKYAKTAFVFIDDPTQCMDEINIASLSDLLRVELRDRQVIMSTHEQDIANYLIYRYSKAGLSHQKINLLQKHRDIDNH